jgi:hypothetical protein
LTASTSDLGWSVTVSSLRLCLSDLRFTILGEAHAARPGLWRRVVHASRSWVESTAWAHPGHLADGEVTGELTGPFIADVAGPSPTALGTATLLWGTYRGANVTARRCEVGDGLVSDDALLGHTAHLVAQASRQGRTIAVEARIDLEAGTQLVGVPFDLVVDGQTQGALSLEVLTQDPTRASASGGSLFDLVDFGAADSDGDGRVDLAEGAEGHAILKRALSNHSFYRVVAR